MPLDDASNIAQAALNPANDPPPETTSAAPAVQRWPQAVNDPEFMQSLRTLIRLRLFIVQNGKRLPAGFSLSDLYNIKPSVMGESPTNSQWSEVEDRSNALYALLTDQELLSFSRSEMPRWVLYCAVALTLVAAAALFSCLVFSFTTGDFRQGAVGKLLSYVLWSASLGAIGSVASIGMNALSIQSDMTFDMSNSMLIALRIVVGGLIAFIITLPIGYPSFSTFVQNLWLPKPPPSSAADISQQAVLLLLPFLLGYSTSLVILILNRLVAAAQTIFGGAPERKANQDG